MFRLLSYYLNKSGLNHNIILLCFDRPTDGADGRNEDLGISPLCPLAGSTRHDGGLGGIQLPLDTVVSYRAF